MEEVGKYSANCNQINELDRVVDLDEGTVLVFDEKVHEVDSNTDRDDKLEPNDKVLAESGLKDPNDSDEDTDKVTNLSLEGQAFSVLLSSDFFDEEDAADDLAEVSQRKHEKHELHFAISRK